MSEQLTPRQVLEQEFNDYLENWWVLQPEKPKFEELCKQLNDFQFAHNAMVRWARVCVLQERMHCFKSIHDFVNDMMDWAAVTFPKATTESCLTHLEQEVREVKDCVQSLALRKDTQEEIADCFILLMQAASREGFSFKDIFEAAQAKMVVNKNREWGTPDADGVVNHVKE